jgi:integrase
MPKLDLSRDRSVKAIKVDPANKIDYSDASLPGFVLRVSPSGRKTWCVVYRPKSGPKKGKQRRYLMEPVYPALNCADARKQAGDILAAIAEGHDPVEERAVTKTAPAPPKPATFDQTVDKFVEVYAKPRQRTWEETERTLKKSCAPWLDRPFSEITKADAYDLLEGYVADGHPYKAVRTLSWLRTLWRWAARRDIVEAPIMDMVELHVDKRVRDRVYSKNEIKALWAAADKLAAKDGKGVEHPDVHCAAYLKLLLLLGVRKSELAGMRIGELDDPEKPTLWIVPHERTKTKKTRTSKRAYLVPLPPLAQRVLRSLPRVEVGLVFPGRRIGQPMKPGSALMRRIREASGVADFSFHTARHTITTWLQEQGHSEFERGLILNHADSGVTGGYSHSYPVELKRELLAKWAKHVEGIVAPEGAAVLL